MITDKAKRLFKRTQALFDNLSDQDTISSLERDLMLSYLRDLYAELSNPSTAIPESRVKTESFDEVREHATAIQKEEQKVTKPTPEWLEPPVKETTGPAHIETPKKVPVQEETQPSFSASFDTATSPEKVSREPVSASVVMHHEDVNTLAALFEFKEVGELSEKLKMQPIDRIEHGMGINERVLAVNELFNGNNELFKVTLERLNGLQNFTDAKLYLINGVASQYKWADDVRKKKAQYFIQLVRRKYINN